jgi:Flp pilus assembly protein TadG
MVFFAGQVLESAASEAARFVMTGQAQSNNWDATAFKQQICGTKDAPTSVNLIFTCANINIDVRNYSNSFSSVNTAPPVVTDSTTGVKSLDTSKMGYNPGGPRCITAVQLFYRWPIYVSLLGNSLANLGGSRLLVATSIFRNEPYSTTGSCS